MNQKKSIIGHWSLAHWSLPRRGFSLIELIIAIGVFMILIGGVISVVAGSHLSLLANEQRATQAARLTETWEALRSIRDNDWTTLTDGAHGLSDATGHWQFSGASDTSDGITRAITVSDVTRDAAGDIDPAADVDPDSKAVRIELTWEPTPGQPQNIVVNTVLDNYVAASVWPPAPPAPPITP